MITFPKPYVATKYPGYFFNKEDNQLYSLKIDGVLKPIKYYKADWFNNFNLYPIKLKDGTRVYSEGGYRVSVKGRRKFYPIELLKEIEEHDATMPVQEA